MAVITLRRPRRRSVRNCTKPTVEVSKTPHESLGERYVIRLSPGNIARFDRRTGESTRLVKPSWRPRYTQYEDSTVVWVPDSGVVLLGDSFYPPPYHLRRPGDGYDHEVIYTVLHAYRGAEWCVDSHDDPRPRSALDGLLNRQAE